MPLIRTRRLCAAILALTLSMIQPVTAASANLVLSEMIVDLQPGTHAREDVEVANDGPDRLYVAVEPALIVNPGSVSQTRTTDPDPEQLGLLATPARMILEPGQRRLLRIAAIGAIPRTERVYRVTVKPVAGPIASASSGLKILVGYDMLVLVRPANPRIQVDGVRNDRTLVVTNSGNSSVELLDGKQCDAIGKQCVSLPAKRLYAGARFSQPLTLGGPVEYRVKSPLGEEHKHF